MSQYTIYLSLVFISGPY